MSQRQCEGCRWFHRVGTGMVGECRRYPPQLVNTQHGWLIVEQSEFCGEWSDKNITREQHERRELVQQFAVAIVSGLKDAKQCYPADIWADARRYAEAENWR